MTNPTNAQELQKERDKPEIKAFVEAVFLEDPERLRTVLHELQLTKEQLNGPWFHFDSPAIVQAKNNLAIVDVLLQAGADIHQKSHWWAGGFGVLDGVDKATAQQLILRGAKLDAWSASEQGDLEELKRIVTSDPTVVHAKGPDGKRPLHCAASVAVARYLVEAGAELDAKCVDHESTAVQYAVGDHPDVARFLIDQGCQTDLMLAAAMGDQLLLATILDEDPSQIETIISRRHFPSSAADHIYSWKLGWYLTPHQVAEKYQQLEALEYLQVRSSPAVRLLNACLMKNQELAREVSKTEDVSSLIGELKEHSRQQVAHAARNNDAQAVGMLLESGFPVETSGQHQATALHWGAFHGNLAMVECVLAYKPNLEAQDADFRSTPLGWALHGMSNGWYRETGDFLGCVRVLVDAGANYSGDGKTGNDQVDALLSASRKT